MDFDGKLLEFANDSAILSELDHDAASAVDAALKGRRDQSLTVSEEAVKTLREGYLAQVKALYVNAMFEKLFAEARKIDPMSVADLMRVNYDVLKQAEGILLKQMAPHPIRLFRREFTMIPELEERIRRNFIDAQIEMLDRIADCRDALSRRFFHGKKITAVEGLSGMAGDVHRHGRSVAGVKTNAGKFYYKPHDCSLDVLYHRLVEEFFADCTVAADCISGEGFGLVQEMKRLPLKKKSQAADYYRHLGMLTALFRGIGTTDMHNENLLPCGDKPAAIDLETMFRPSFSESRQEAENTGNKFVSAMNEVSSSVLTTGMMPGYTPSLGCASPLYVSSGRADHLPFTRGNFYSVKGYEEDYIEGFRVGYRRIMENRDRILALLMTCQNTAVRFVLRNTMYYAQVQMQLNRGRYLVSREKQEELLNRLKVVYELSGVKVNEPVVRYEAACLREGDIPYFCIPFDGKALCGGSPEEVILPHYLRESIRDRIADRLGGMNEKNERFETDLLRTLLRQAPTDQPEEDTKTPAVPGRAVSADQIPAAAEEIGRLLSETVLHMSGGSVLWYSQVDRMFAIDEGGFDVTSASAGLYLVCLKKAGLSWQEDLAEKCLDTLRDGITLYERSDAQVVRKSTLGFPGLALYPMATDALAQAGVDGANALFERVIRLLNEKEIHLQDDPKKQAALAELLLVICRSETACPGKAEWIENCAQALSAFTPGKKTTVAHLASVAAALALAGKADVSGSLLAAIRSGYRADLTGWPDEKAKFRWLAGRGAQAPWIGLCALMAQKAGVAGAGELVHLSLDSLMGEKCLRCNDSLYHGNALSVLFLTEAARQGYGARYARRAGRLLAAMLQRKKKKGAFTIFPEGSRDAFDAAFFRGTPGIGAAALNWQGKERIF